MKGVLKNMKIILTILIMLMCAMNTQQADAQATDSAKAQIDFYATKFRDILKTIVENYDADVDIPALSDKCFNAMLGSLDPFSHYFTAETWRQMTAENRGKTVGGGLEFFRRGDSLVVIEVAPQSPAENAGIKTGDIILFIGGKSFLGKSASEARAALEGADSTKIEIIIKQTATEYLKSLTLTRHEFAVKSLGTHFIIPHSRTLYLKLLRFSGTSPDEIREAIRSYSRKKFDTLVIDLKGNQGGALNSVIEICKDFTSLGDSILFTKAKNAEYRYDYVNDREGEFSKIPLVVLVNSASASASEIFAGVVQDLDRGQVVGENTTGKGLVQKSWNYTDTSAFRLTVAKYYTPSGRLIQKPYNVDTNEVIDPSLKLSMSPEAYEQLRQTLIANGGMKNVPIYHTRSGRPVIALGGIRPDVSVASDSLTLLTETLKSRGLNLEFALDYIAANPTVSGTATHWATTFSLSDAVISEFTAFCIARNCWNQGMYDRDKAIIAANLKATIGYLLYGNSAYYAVLALSDPQVRACLR